MKTNPCIQCLIKPCCTNVCTPKEEYTEELIGFLCRLGQQIYKLNGKRKRNISKLIISAYDEAAILCEINRNENNQILKRHIHSVVH